jgi:DNA-binding HxlR family transcriptional regulator
MKLTDRKTQHGKWYGDACGAAFALELLGERWSLLIVRELMFGGRRFKNLRASLPDISAKVLTERLHGLEAAGIVRRAQLPSAPAQIYELTPWGYRADEILLPLCRWALASPGHDHTLFLSPAAMMMSLRALFDPRLGVEEILSGEIRMGAERYRVCVADARFTVVPGAGEAPGFTIAAPDAALVKLLIYGRMPPAMLAADGLAISGDGLAADRFVGLFHFPEPLSQYPA